MTVPTIVGLSVLILVCIAVGCFWFDSFLLYLAIFTIINIKGLDASVKKDGK